ASFSLHDALPIWPGLRLRAPTFHRRRSRSQSGSSARSARPYTVSVPPTLLCSTPRTSPRTTVTSPATAPPGRNSTSPSSTTSSPSIRPARTSKPPRAATLPATTSPASSRRPPSQRVVAGSSNTATMWSATRRGTPRSSRTNRSGSACAAATAAGAASGTSTRASNAFAFMRASSESVWTVAAGLYARRTRAVSPRRRRDAPRARLPVRQDPQVLRREGGGAPRVAEPQGRLERRLVAEPERAPVHGDEGAAPAEVEIRLHRFLRVHVHRAHEPARRVRADREQRGVERAEPRADLREPREVATVAAEVDRGAARGAQREGCPEPPRIRNE